MPDFATLKPAQPDFSTLKPVAPVNHLDGYSTVKPDLLSRATQIATSIFPGTGAIGESLGTAAFNVGQLVKGKPLAPVDIPKTIGGYLQAGATVAGAGVGGGVGATAAERVGNAALAYGGLGATSGVGAGLESGKDAKGVIQAGLVGGTTGAALGAAGKTLGEAASSANRLLSHTSNTPEAAMKVLQERPVAAQAVGTAKATNALEHTQGVVRGLRSQLTNEWTSGVDQVVAENNSVRVGLPSDTEKLFHKVEDLVGGFDGVPADISNLSAKELIGLQTEVNSLANKTAYKISPEGVPVRRLADQLKELGVKAFGGEKGAYATLYKNYSAKKTVLDAANDIVKAYQTGKPITQKTALARLEAVFNENAPSYLQAMKDLEAATGEDVLSQLAASKFTPILPKPGAGLATSLLHYLALPLTSPRAAAFLSKALPNASKRAGALLGSTVAPVSGALGNASNDFAPQ